MKPAATYELLVDSVGPWDFTGSFVPCELLRVGEDVRPVLVSSKKQVRIAISQYGKGQMVAVSHEGILKDSKSQFLRNAMEWLKPSPEALVGICPHLDSLSQLLLGAGTKVLMDAYDSMQAQDLVSFVKGDAGLLTGGLAWHWASHGKEKVLFEILGNQVSGMAGMYFAGNAVETGIFKVARKIPKIPLIVLHQANLGLDAEFLLCGMSELDLVTGGIPSIVLAHSVPSFPLCLSGKGLHRGLFAVACNGRGCVLWATREGQLFSPKLTRFLLNAIRWLGAGRKGLVGADASLKKLCSLFFQEKVKLQVSQLMGDTSGCCGSSYSNREAERVHAFVAEGDGQLFGGQASYWASQNRSKAAVAKYPGSKILHHFGLIIWGQSVQAAKHPAMGSGEHNYFCKALTLFNRHVDKHEELKALLEGLAAKLAQNSTAFLHVPAHGCPAYALLHRILTEVLRKSGIPTSVSRHCPVKSNSKEAIFLCMATELSLTMMDSAVLVQKSAAGVCALPVPVEIDGTNPGKTAWKSTGLYLPGGPTAVLTFPCLMVGAGLKVQTGCHTDDLSHATELTENRDLFLLCYYSELAVENRIRMVPSDSIHHMENPQPLLTLWNEIMVAISKLAAIPTKFPSPERIVTDVQISFGRYIAAQIGCHSHDLSCAAELQRPPLAVKEFEVEKTTVEVSSLWGGLIYIIVPKESTLGQISVTIKEAVQAPFFKFGETDISAWQSMIHQHPAPWAELATENIILTVPAADVHHMDNPESLLSIWNKMMNAIARLAAIPATFPRPERMVADVQISHAFPDRLPTLSFTFPAGWMHAGYPVLHHLESVTERVDVQSLQANGLWGTVHELGHNQLQSECEFPPLTTEATYSLWSVYVNEAVLGIPRDKAHNALALELRKKRIQDYIENGAQLKDWEVFAALETCLWLQEAFGKEAFTEIFSEYQNISELPDDNGSKINLWAETFSHLVKKNLTPFFKAWGWPIKETLSQQLAVSFPSCSDDPVNQYIS
ncbi:LOW QUALITY PROTEIN: TRPM8 channel-associated factor 2-like [Morus bassanus]